MKTERWAACRQWGHELFLQEKAVTPENCQGNDTGKIYSVLYYSHADAAKLEGKLQKKKSSYFTTIRHSNSPPHYGQRAQGLHQQQRIHQIVLKAIPGQVQTTSCSKSASWTRPFKIKRRRYYPEQLSFYTTKGQSVRPEAKKESKQCQPTWDIAIVGHRWVSRRSCKVPNAHRNSPPLLPPVRERWCCHCHRAC